MPKARVLATAAYHTRTIGVLGILCQLQPITSPGRTLGLIPDLGRFLYLVEFLQIMIPGRSTERHKQLDGLRIERLRC